MKQLSRYENMTILFDEFVLSVYKDFTVKLLETQQVKNKKGYYFKKSSNLPRNTIFLKSFLKARYAYEDFNYIMALYNFILSEVDKISLNAFYNLCSYLSTKQIYKIDSNLLYDCLDYSRKLTNNLEEKNTVIPHLKFLKSIGETKHG